jgi:WD40 repeat protein
VIAFSPAGDLVLASDPERVIYVWDADSGNLLHELRGHFDRIDSVAVSPDGRTIAGAGEEGTLSFWHRATGQLLFTLRIEGYDARRQVCQFSPDGRWIGVTAGLHRVRLLQLR